MSPRLFDLSHEIPKAPTFAGGETFGRGAVMGWSQLSETKLVQNSLLTFSDHVSTHMEAPSHFNPEGKSIDQMSPDLFLEVPALWLDCSGNSPGIAIEVQELESALTKIDEETHPGDAILLYTGCSRRWGRPEYRHGTRPVSPSAVEWILAQGVKLFGVDGPEIDTDPIEWPAHKLLRQHEFYIIENLALWPAVTELPHRMRLITAPLAIRGATASPARVVAVVD